MLKLDLQRARRRMVETQLAARNIHSKAVLEAMGSVPREDFLPPEMAEFAYQDCALPIADNQTISQPYIVALMAQELQLKRTDKVLEVGAGSGYAAAVLSKLCREVHTIERIESLAREAAARLKFYRTLHVHAGDGTRGWPEAAPYDAIVVAAGGPRIPQALLDQLAPGGRLVMPFGEYAGLQSLLRITRERDSFRHEVLDAVRFVPLIPEGGWDAKDLDLQQLVKAKPAPVTVPQWIAHEAQPFQDIESADLSSLLERIGEARVVLLGEASHGTSEFYRMRARITRELILKRKIQFVAVEADWPDARHIDDYVRGYTDGKWWQVFSRFPTWMWRNQEVQAFVEWLRLYNLEREREDRVGFFGLDLYSLYTSLNEVVGYLERVDPAAADSAKKRYGCLTPWEKDPAAYGNAVLSGRYESCEDAVVETLQKLLEQRIHYAPRDPEAFLDAELNARLVRDAERYYRVIYYGSHSSWNLRDQHMMDTLQSLLQFYPDSRAAVWAHNSHLGDARATEMGWHGELNLGELCRKAFGERAYLVGFGTHTGEVAAATHWGGPMEIKTVRPSHADSYERLCHDSGVERFFLPLRHAGVEVREQLKPERLERAIGVIYRPQTELASHYFQAVLPQQFDEFVWFDRTKAVTPLPAVRAGAAQDTFPTGL